MNLSSQTLHMITSIMHRLMYNKEEFLAHIRKVPVAMTYIETSCIPIPHNKYEASYI